MRVNANAVLRSWTLLAAFGGSCAPAYTNTRKNHTKHKNAFRLLFMHRTVVLVIIACVTSRMRERRGIRMLYIRRTMLMEGVVSEVIVQIN